MNNNNMLDISGLLNRGIETKCDVYCITEDNTFLLVVKLDNNTIYFSICKSFVNHQI